MEINEDVKIEHGLRTTTLAKFFFFSCTIEKILNGYTVFERGVSIKHCTVTNS